MKSPNDHEFESDPKLPSGEWSGFYCESQRSQRGWMHLYINFSSGGISGEGTDYVGPWTLAGTYDLNSGRCSWVKHYVGKHNVSYEGSASDQGIRGYWNIRGWMDGPFHIWPRNRHDLGERYLKEELENPLPGPSVSDIGQPFE